MTTFILIIVLIFFFFLYIAFGQTPTQQKFNLFSDHRPYLSKKPLTATETKFYHLLVQALPDHVVLAQVQISSFLKVDKSRIKHTDSYRWFNHIAQQSIDYLICTKDFSIVAAIELDDKSHAKAEAITRDIKKTNNLAAANVPLIRWHAEAMPELETIKQTILNFATSSESHQLESKEWIHQDEKEQFFNRSKKQAASFPLPIFIIAFVVVFLIVGNNLVTTIFKTPFSQQTKTQPSINQQLHNQQQQTSPNNALQELMAKQQLARMAQEESKRQAQVMQQQLIQQQEQAKFAQNREAALKEEAWKRYDKNRVDCTTENNIVKCGNDYISKRRKFEQLWEAQKIGSNN